MRKFYSKNYKQLNLNVKLEQEHLIKKLIKLKRKKKNFIINNDPIFKKSICIESGRTRSVSKDFYLNRMNLKNAF